MGSLKLFWAPFLLLKLIDTPEHVTATEYQQAIERIEYLRETLKNVEPALQTVTKMETVKQRSVVFEKVNEKLDNVEDRLMDFTNSKLVTMGKEYKLREWMTLSDYYKKYDVKPSSLSNWIQRGIIPEGSIFVIPELNGLKLIKNQPHNARRYAARVVRPTKWR